MRFLATLLALAAFVVAPAVASAQDFASAFAGFNTDSSVPIQIEADQLEIRNEEKIAIYSGQVKVRQGDTVLEAPALRIHYIGEATTAGVPGSQVTTIEAGPGVVVRSGERTASGDNVILDMQRQLITMTGNVVITEGQNVVRGQRLFVNLATKQGRIEGGRVQTLISPPAEGGAGQ
jgi:lipopolysaccharide export system protein LptA